MRAQAKKSVATVVRAWLEECRPSSKAGKKGELSRNAVAVGLVVLDRLREERPLAKTDMFSAGGEVKGVRSGLAPVLEKYDLPASFLKEATGRQASHYAERLLDEIEYGRWLSIGAEGDRQLLAGIEVLRGHAREWLGRQNLKIACDRAASPSFWVRQILEAGKGKSKGKVEQHLVGAKLAERFPKMRIPNHPGHAGDEQTKRFGDFDVIKQAIHVTVVPGRSVAVKCKSNINSGKLPILLVPRDQMGRAQFLLEQEEVLDRTMLLAIEDYISQNIIEMAAERGEDYFTVLESIVIEYNRRVEEVETDMALKIDLC